MFHLHRRKVKQVLTAMAAATTAATSINTAHAGLFIAKGNHLFMNVYSPTAQEVQGLYGISREVSAGLAYKRYLEDGEARSSSTLQVNRLIHRWMTPDAVGNLYVYGNLGVSERSLPAMVNHQHPGAPVMPGRREDGNIYAAGIWADYETRQFYSRLSSTRWIASDYQHTVTTAQLGLSPIRAEYDEIAPWVVIQAERKRGLSRTTQVTPMLRLIYKAWWVELGATTSRANRGDVYFNVMHTF
jgi:hypothetical protein